jgi:D-Tyr-tRNAtyr deacylase
VDQLRNAIYYRAWGQKDPLVEYKKEAYDMFVDLMTDLRKTVGGYFYRAQIGPGLCVLLGVEIGDTEHQAQWMARKLALLRIFRDEQDKMNRSVQDIGGAVLVVSQFTLAGDCTQGNRPSFVVQQPQVGTPCMSAFAGCWKLNTDCL